MSKKNISQKSYRSRYLQLLKKNDNGLDHFVGSDQFYKGYKNEDMILIAGEIWKIQKKINKIKDSFGEDTIKGFDYSVEKICEVLDNNKIKVIDYTGKKYLEGMNGFDIVSVEKNDAVIEPIFLDTISPIIEENGLVVQRGKVVILSN